MYELSPGSLRDQRKAQTRELIVDAAMAALAENRFDKATHDTLAKAVGVARRTVYRYFPDRDAIMQAVWARLNVDRDGRMFGLPTDEASITEPQALRDFYAALDAQGPVLTVALASVEGRKIRALMHDARVASWRAALADATAALPEGERDLAVAAVQLLRNGVAWLEMREQWGLDAEQMATACGWAMRALIADLRGRTSLDAEEKPSS